MSSLSPLTGFCNMLVRFFEELKTTFPEQREISAALETIQGAKRINPRLILDMFYENVTKHLKEAIAKEDVDYIVSYGRMKINQQYNEIMSAITIFDNHWAGLSDSNRSAIWKYLKVLVALSEKAQSDRV
jgi:hypothetical protein